MTYQMTVSPDFPPQHIAGWYIFNTWLQNELGIGIHLELYPDFASQREAILHDQVDLVYANPYDAAMLIRQKGFQVIARPQGKVDEALIAARVDAPFQEVEDLPAGLRLAATIDPAVYLLGMMMLEPAELDESNLQIQRVESYPVAAKLLIQGQADIAFFLKEAFEDLSNLTRRELKVLVESQIGDLFHTFLVGPRLASRSEDFRQALLHMAQSPKGPGVLEALGIAGWDPVTPEEAEFMINLIEALK